MWCPKCKYRYLTDQTKCIHCGGKLKKEPNCMPEQGYRFLVTCQDEFDLQLKLGLLNSCQISAIRNYMPKGIEFEIYSKQNGFGTDLFVAIDQYEEALEILNAQTEN
jgi:hypothetical protein